MNDSIAAIIQALQQAFPRTNTHPDHNLTVEEVAELLWLAPQLTSSSQIAVPPADVHHAQDRATVSSSELESESTDASAENTTALHLYSQKRVDEHTSFNSGMPVRITTAPALKDALKIGRALRPLRRRFPSHRRYTLNVQATVQQIAEMGKKVRVPVFTPAMTRRFELVLVIDQGSSMVFWQQTIIELRNLLEHLGAFRDVRVWRLLTNHEDRIQLYAGTDSATMQPERQLEELLDPTGHRLILVLTDCVSPAWRSGKAQEALELWGQKNQITLLQMLPKQFWPRTSLCAAETVSVSSSAPGAANTRLKLFEAFPDVSGELSIPIPVVTLDPSSLAAWARMVIGADTTRLPAVRFVKDVQGLIKEFAPPQQTAISAKERVRTFMASSSDTAHKLARLLSTIPISLPIVRLVQQVVLPEATQEHVIEVFLGDLLEEIYRDPSALHPEYREFDFLPGVRDELHRRLSGPEEYKFLRALSAYLVQHLGQLPDFLARVALPNASSALQEWTIPEESLPFARFTAIVWRKLGGQYSTLADQLEQQLEHIPSRSSVMNGLELTTKSPLVTTEQAQLTAARTLPDPKTRTQALLRLLPHISSAVQSEIINDVLEITQLRTDRERALEDWLPYLKYVPEALMPGVLQEMLELARHTTNEELLLRTLETIIQHISGIWSEAAVRESLIAIHSIHNEAARESLLHALLLHAPENMQHQVAYQVEPLRPAVPIIKADPPIAPSDIPAVTVTCPSCFKRVFIGECRIISGREPGKVLKKAPRKGLEQSIARATPESLMTGKYRLEDARRECPHCLYLLPYNIERALTITLPVIGNVFTGKSHYIAALLHQMKTEWIEQLSLHLTCLTPQVEELYIRDYLEPLYQDLHTLPTTPQTRETTGQPLIYELSLSPRPLNLIFYDLSGEVFEDDAKTVQFAGFVFSSGAFIFAVDPMRMVPVLRQMPLYLQRRLESAFEYAGVLQVHEDRRESNTVSRFLSLIERIQRQSEGAAFDNLPVAVMVAKSDLLYYLNLQKDYSFFKYPDYSQRLDFDVQDCNRVDQEVRDFLSAYGQGDLLTTTARLKRVKFFATSATGQPPDELGRFDTVKSCRCLDPVLWTLYQYGILLPRLQ